MISENPAPQARSQPFGLILSVTSGLAALVMGVIAKGGRRGSGGGGCGGGGGGGSGETRTSSGSGGRGGTGGRARTGRARVDLGGPPRQDDGDGEEDTGDDDDEGDVQPLPSGVDWGNFLQPDRWAHVLELRGVRHLEDGSQQLVIYHRERGEEVVDRYTIKTDRRESWDNNDGFRTRLVRRLSKLFPKSATVVEAVSDQAFEELMVRIEERSGVDRRNCIFERPAPRDGRPNPTPWSIHVDVPIRKGGTKTVFSHLCATEGEARARLYRHLTGSTAHRQEEPTEYGAGEGVGLAEEEDLDDVGGSGWISDGCSGVTPARPEVDMDVSASSAQQAHPQPSSSSSSSGGGGGGSSSGGGGGGGDSGGGSSATGGGSSVKSGSGSNSIGHSGGVPGRRATRHQSAVGGGLDTPFQHQIAAVDIIHERLFGTSVVSGRRWWADHERRPSDVNRSNQLHQLGGGKGVRLVRAIAKMQEPFVGLSQQECDGIDITCVTADHYVQVAEQRFRPDVGLPGYILGDEMGMGKTATALLTAWRLAQGRSDARILVVVPSKARSVWRSEAHRWLPSGVTYLEPQRGDLWSELTGKPELVVISREVFLATYEGTIEHHMWDLVVLDEATGLRGRESYTRECVDWMRDRQGTKVLAITGTPYGASVETACNLLEAVGWPITSTKRADVAQAFGQCMVRRTAEEIAAGPDNVHVPQVTHARINVPLTPCQRALSLHALGEHPSKTQLAKALPKLRRICQFAHPHPTRFVRSIRGNLDAAIAEVSPKVALVRLMVSELPPSARIIVFAVHEHTLRALRAGLTGIKFAVVDGSTTAEAAQAEVDLFERGARRVCVLSTKTGGRAINLPTATHIVLVEATDTAGELLQSVARPRRLGRDASLPPIKVFHLVTPATIDEGNWLSMWSRAALLQQLLCCTRGSVADAGHDDSETGDPAWCPVLRRRMALKVLTAEQPTSLPHTFSEIEAGFAESFTMEGAMNHAIEALLEQETKTAKQDEDERVATLKQNATDAEKQTAMEMPARRSLAKPLERPLDADVRPPKAYGREILTRRVEVKFWHQGAWGWFKGTVKEMDVIGEHLLVFDDGDQKWMAIAMEEREGLLTFLSGDAAASGVGAGKTCSGRGEGGEGHGGRGKPRKRGGGKGDARSNAPTLDIKLSDLAAAAAKVQLPVNVQISEGEESDSEMEDLLDSEQEQPREQRAAFAGACTAITSGATAAEKEKKKEVAEGSSWVWEDDSGSEADGFETDEEVLHARDQVDKDWCKRDNDELNLAIHGKWAKLGRAPPVRELGHGAYDNHEEVWVADSISLKKLHTCTVGTSELPDDLRKQIECEMPASGKRKKVREAMHSAPPISRPTSWAAGKWGEHGYTFIETETMHSHTTSGKPITSAMWRLPSSQAALDGPLAPLVAAAPYAHAFFADAEASGGMQASRGTKQAYVGHTARPRASVLLNQAYGVADGVQGFSGVDKISTLLSADYVESSKEEKIPPNVQAAMTMHAAPVLYHRGERAKTGIFQGMPLLETALKPIVEVSSDFGESAAAELDRVAPQMMEEARATVDSSVRHAPNCPSTSAAVYYSGDLGCDQARCDAAAADVKAAQADLEAAKTAAADAAGKSKPGKGRKGKSAQAKTPSKAAPQSMAEQRTAAIDAATTRRNKLSAALRKASMAAGRVLVDAVAQADSVDFGEHVAFRKHEDLSVARETRNRLVREGRLPVAMAKSDNLVDAGVEGDGACKARWFQAAFDEYAVRAPKGSREEEEAAAETVDGSFEAADLSAMFGAEWTERGVCLMLRELKLIGHEGVAREIEADCAGAASDYTEEVHEQLAVLFAAYETAIDGVFAPWRFLDDDRTPWLVERVIGLTDAEWAGLEDRALLGRLLGVAWASCCRASAPLQQDLSTSADLFDLTSVDAEVNKWRLFKRYRDDWVDPELAVNGNDVQRQVERGERKKNCSCGPELQCMCGKRQDNEFVTSLQRAQTQSFHESVDKKQRRYCQARDCLNSVTELLGDPARTTSLIKALTDGGEQAVRSELTSILHVAGIRATQMGRMLFVLWHGRRLRGGVGSVEVPAGDQSQVPVIERKPAERLLAFVDDCGESLTEQREFKAVVDAELRHLAATVPSAIERHWQSMLKQHPVLRWLNVPFHNLKLHLRWDVSRLEELPCEIGKLIVGRARAALRAAGVGEADLPRPLQGIWGPKTRRAHNLPRIKPRLRNRLTTTLVSDNELRLEYVSIVPVPPPTTHAAQPAETAWVGTTPAMTREECAVAAAERNLSKAKRLEAKAKKAAAETEGRKKEWVEERKKQKAELKKMKSDKGPLTPQQRAQWEALLASVKARCSHGDDLAEAHAYHVWCAASFGSSSQVGKQACALHLDHQDHAEVTNMIGSIGVDKDGHVVPLRGALLAVVLGWASKPLADNIEAAELPEGAVFDQQGNVVMYEPTATQELFRLDPALQARAPSKVSEARELCCAGRAVIAYFPSGGFTGGQVCRSERSLTRSKPVCRSGPSPHPAIHPAPTCALLDSHICILCRSSTLHTCTWLLQWMPTTYSLERFESQPSCTRQGAQSLQHWQDEQQQLHGAQMAVQRRARWRQSSWRQSDSPVLRPMASR